MTNDHDNPDDQALRTALSMIADDTDPAALTPRIDSRITRHRRRRAIAASLGVAAIVALAVIVPVTVHHAKDAPPASTAPPAHRTTTPPVGTPIPTGPGATASGPPVPKSDHNRDTKVAGLTANATISLAGCNAPLPQIPAADPDLTLTMTSADGPNWTVSGTNAADTQVIWTEGGGNVVLIDDQDHLALAYPNSLGLLTAERPLQPGASWLEKFPSNHHQLAFCTGNSTMDPPGSKPRLNPGRYRAIGVSSINGNDRVTEPMALIVDSAGRIRRG
ncbi:hypothetical protein [Nakamurella lactea]|uniref:hypothetical protein n=1 Tax=Nakamurella lactea TaxID=459515 RepID=UPI00041237F1|nr:hypothetical protein [Nakamurella lactea]